MGNSVIDEKRNTKHTGGFKSTCVLEKGIEVLRKADPDIAILLKKRETELLSLYIEEIELFNPIYSLVGAKEREELVIKHILDSLAPLGIISRLLPKNSEIADIGSGAGLPGIPLAISLSDHSFTLIEKMSKRVKFLKNTQAVLGLSNVKVEEKDFSKISCQKFDLITFRAFAALDTNILKTLFQHLKPTGIIVAYKGRKEKIEDELKNINPLNEITQNIFKISVPFLEDERHIVVLHKNNQS